MTLLALPLARRRWLDAAGVILLVGLAAGGLACRLLERRDIALGQ